MEIELSTEGFQPSVSSSSAQVLLHHTDNALVVMETHDSLNTLTHPLMSPMATTTESADTNAATALPCVDSAPLDMNNETSVSESSTLSSSEEVIAVDIRIRFLSAEERIALAGSAMQTDSVDNDSNLELRLDFHFRSFQLPRNILPEIDAALQRTAENLLHPTGTNAMTTVETAVHAGNAKTGGQDDNNEEETDGDEVLFDEDAIRDFEVDGDSDSDDSEDEEEQSAGHTRKKKKVLVSAHDKDEDDEDEATEDFIMTGDIEADRAALHALLLGAGSDDESDGESTGKDKNGTKNAAKTSKTKLKNGDDMNEDDEDGDVEEEAEAVGPIRSKNEILESDLPPPASFVIPASESITTAGRVFNVVENLVLVQAEALRPALDIESVLCFSDRTPLGVIDELIGNIYEPFYSVRLPKVLPFPKAYLSSGVQVFSVDSKSHRAAQDCVPGSDASNQHDEEVAANEQEFSDDEKEAEHRAKVKAHKKQKKKRETGTTDDTTGNHLASSPSKTSKHQQNSTSQQHRQNQHAPLHSPPLPHLPTQHIQPSSAKPWNSLQAQPQATQMRNHMPNNSANAAKHYPAPAAYPFIYPNSSPMPMPYPYQYPPYAYPPPPSHYTQPPPPHTIPYGYGGAAPYPYTSAYAPYPPPPSSQPNH